MVALARAYATTRPAAIRRLIGIEHHREGARMVRTISCLPALVGAWRDRGGGILGPTAWAAYSPLDQDALAGPQPDTRAVNMVRLGHALTELDPPVHALVVYNSNPATTAPDSTRVMQGLARDDLFTVVLEHFLTDTARYADVVLPATTQVEHVDLVPSWGHTYVTYNEPAIAPVGEALPNTEIFRRLARAMGFDAQPFEATDEELARAALAGARAPLDTIDFERLREVGWAEADLPEDFRPFAQGGFGTPSGRLRLWSDGLPPGFDPPPGDAEPLALMTVKSAHHFLNSTYANLPRHLAGEGEPLLEMHADDAAPRGIADGDVVRVSNARGEVVARARLGDVVRPGVVALPSGWWASRSPGGTMANALTTPELTDRGGGGAFHSARVEVEPAARTGRRGRQHGKSSSGGPMTRSRLFKLALPAAVVLGAGTAVAIAAIPSVERRHHRLPRDDRDDPGAAAGHRHGGDPAAGLQHRRGDDHLERAGPARPAGRPRAARRLRVAARTPRAAAAAAARRSTRARPAARRPTSSSPSTGSRATAPTPSTRTRSRSSRSPSWPSGRPRAPSAPSASPACGWTRSTTSRRPGSCRRRRAGATSRARP